MTLDELSRLCERGSAPNFEVHALTPMLYVAYHVDGEQRRPLTDKRGTLHFTSRYAAQSALAGTGLQRATFVHESAYDEMDGGAALRRGLERAAGRAAVAPRLTVRAMPILRGLLIALLLATATAHAAPASDLWPFWDASDETSDTRVDHQAWQRLLDSYLLVTEALPTLFRYDAVTAEDRAALDGYIDELAAIDPRTLARAEQLPYWINLYNALTVQVVLDHPAEDSIRDMGDGFFRPGPWNDELLRIAGQDVTLNDIEHRILRPIWNDHRIHFVVNCASIGCPSLAPRAYTRDNTRELMAKGEQRYLNDPRGLAFLPNGRLRLSSIFDWYVGDFGGDRAALLRYLAGVRPDLAERLQRYDGPIDYHYDWSLNDAS